MAPNKRAAGKTGIAALFHSRRIRPALPEHYRWQQNDKMNADDLIVEARARTIWGEEPSSVRYFLTSNGMSATDADAKLRDLILERNAEIRRLGVRDVLIGAALLGGAGIFFYSLFRSSHIPGVSVRAGKGYGVLALLAFYGLWRLINGIVRLVRPKSEHGSIPDISE